MLNTKYKFYIKDVRFMYYLYCIKFIGRLIYRGKKCLAYKMFYELKYNLKNLIEDTFIEVFFFAMSNIMPKIMLVKKRVGALKKEIPIPLYGVKQCLFAVKLFFKILKKDKNNIKVVDLVNIIKESYNNKGIIVKAKNIMYQTALNNKFLIKLIKK